MPNRDLTATFAPRFLVGLGPADPRGEVERWGEIILAQPRLRDLTPYSHFRHSGPVTGHY